MTYSLRSLIMSIGTHRGQRPLSPLEVAEALVEHTNQVGLEQAKVDVSLEESTLRRFLRLRELPQDVAELVDWGRKPGAISFSTAAEITRVPSLQQRPLAQEALRHGFSKEEVRQIVQVSHRAGMRMAEAVESTLKMRPSVITVFVTLGGLESPEVQAQLRRLSQSERDQFLAKIVASLGADIKAGKLTSNNFSVTSDRALRDQEINDLEHALVAELKARLPGSAA